MTCSRKAPPGGPEPRLRGTVCVFAELPAGRCGGAEGQHRHAAAATGATTASADRSSDPPASGDHRKTHSSDCPMEHCSAARTADHAKRTAHIGPGIADAWRDGLDRVPRHDYERSTGQCQGELSGRRRTAGRAAGWRERAGGSGANRASAAGPSRSPPAGRAADGPADPAGGIRAECGDARGAWHRPKRRCAGGRHGPAGRRESGAGTGYGDARARGRPVRMARIRLRSGIREPPPRSTPLPVSAPHGAGGGSPPRPARDRRALRPMRFTCPGRPP